MFSLTPWRKNRDVQGKGQALAPYSGFEPMTRIREEFDNLFDRFFTGWPMLAENGGRWGVDVQENDNDIVVRAEAPGFEPEDFDLQVRGNQLVLRASKQAETEEKDQGFRQWQQREFYQAVPLPADINPDQVEARYRQGVLTVTLPKTEQGKAKRIQIKG
jgi:HSP20 family protein